MELSFGSMSPDAVEGWRLGASGRSALVLVLVLGTLGFANYIASQLDWKRDWSYLRTTRPSESTLRIAENLDEPLEVVLFYPPANQVAEALLLYLEELEAASQRVRLSVVEHALSRCWRRSTESPGTARSFSPEAMRRRPCVLVSS